MKKLLLLCLLGLSYTSLAQEIPNNTDISEKIYSIASLTDSQSFTPNSINASDDEIIINNNIKVKKGDKIKVLLPGWKQSDYAFIEKKKSVINAKLIGDVADIASSGAISLGRGRNSYEMFRKARAISWGADALNKLEDINLSKKAKKIAAKNLTIVSWEQNSQEEIILLTTLGKQKYNVDLNSALFTNEIQLVDYELINENKE